MFRTPLDVSLAEPLPHTAVELLSNCRMWQYPAMSLDALFREATLRICRHLDVEKSLHGCFELLREQMPARTMYLDHYDHGQGVVRTIAMANADGGRRLDRSVPMPPALRQQIESFRGHAPSSQDPTESPVFAVPRVPDDPICVRMFEALGEPLDSSLIGVYPDDGERVLGAVVLIAEGPDRFTAEHEELFALLRLPFGVALSNALRHREVLELKERLADDKRFLQHEILRLTGEEIIGEEFGLAPAVRMARQVAAHGSPVLLLGETGVGKDVLAHHIHAVSPRRDGPMIKVNCGAIPEGLVDSELFGHEKGAFTGALSQRRGRFERANGGTIFLDEVGELPPPAQVRLLRVLQQKEIERVGGHTTIALDLRVIAATHRDLEDMVEAGGFRRDLWFRLAVFPITIPPLRERRGDIPALVSHFLRKKSMELKLRTTPKPYPEVLHQLMAYDWPGNVRELQNVIERALVLAGDAERLDSDVIALGRPGAAPSAGAGQDPGEALALDHVVRLHIERVLALTEGKVHGPDGAAALLQLNPSTLRHRMDKLGIAYGRASPRDGKP
ncbi:MAG: sigma 54-interacting transcriptional regulator [Acidobacteriota bacterium]